jgi:predicted small lipoprotein YifL
MKKLLPLFIFTVFILSGCGGDNPVTSPPNDNSTGKLVLTIDKHNAPASVVLVEATLSRDGFQPIYSELNLLSDSTASLTLENIPTGLWHLKVNAKNQSGVVEYTGETDVNILANTVVEVNLTLYPVPGSTGGIHLLVSWGGGGSEEPIFLIIDEDAIDNGIQFNSTGGSIIPEGPQYFSDWDVNDDMSSKTQRSVLRYFHSNKGKTITIQSGQTGDEGWFAPNCIPAKWISSYSYMDNTCLTGSEQQDAIKNYLGLNGTSAIPSQERLDKTPDVRPLRALGLNRLIGKIVYAVVYDSDVSINYDHGTPLGVNGNLQGETLGIVVFRVNKVRTLNNFSSSTLPEVQITILDASSYSNSNFMLLSAPVPASSSVPNDRIAPGSPDGYYSLGN